jgi:hypothetical protein
MADAHGHAGAAFANGVVLCQGRIVLETVMRNNADCVVLLGHN